MVGFVPVFYMAQLYVIYKNDRQARNLIPIEILSGGKNEDYRGSCVLRFEARRTGHGFFDPYCAMADDSSALRGPIPDDISTLILRRAQIRDDVARSRRDMQRLAAEYERVEAAIRDISCKDVTPVTPAAVETRSDMARIISKALNEAEAPMTSRALAIRVMEEMDMDSRDSAVRKHIVRRVCVYLWEQVQKGRFRKVQPEATPLRWECVRSAL